MRLVCLWVLVSLAGCDSLDCFDDGPLEAALGDGNSAAVAENTANRDRGRLSGLSLTRRDGEHDGEVEGSADGADDGYRGAAGYPAGYSFGVVDGTDDGAGDLAACAAGVEAGAADGSSAGYGAGFEAASADGYDLGYDDGFAAGEATCSEDVERTAPGGRSSQLPTEATRGLSRGPVRSDAPQEPVGRSEDELACYRRGYADLHDGDAYARGSMLASGRTRSTRPGAARRMATRTIAASAMARIAASPMDTTMATPPPSTRRRPSTTRLVMPRRTTMATTADMARPVMQGMHRGTAMATPTGMTMATTVIE